MEEEGKKEESAERKVLRENGRVQKGEKKRNGRGGSCGMGKLVKRVKMEDGEEKERGKD